ncbi:MAG: hypothetical protein AABZ55_00585, partial [Bdellovibrionota bacterium]
LYRKSEQIYEKFRPQDSLPIRTLTSEQIETAKDESEKDVFCADRSAEFRMEMSESTRQFAERRRVEKESDPDEPWSKCGYN